jgi:Uma2 family endonuclease
MTDTLTKPTRAKNANEPHRFTVAEFERMYFAGVFEEGARLELLRGEVYNLSPQNEQHKYAIISLTETIIEVLGHKVVVAAQMPLNVDHEHYQPEPDVAMLKPPRSQYKTRKNHATDVLWLIEVSDTTLEKDRTEKLPIYASAGVPEVWILNLNTNQLEVYTRPNGDRYARLETFDAGQAVAPQAFPDVKLEWW